MVSSLVIHINLKDIYIYILLSSHNTIIIKTRNVRFILEMLGSLKIIKLKEVKHHVI